MNKKEILRCFLYLILDNNLQINKNENKFILKYFFFINVILFSPEKFMKMLVWLLHWTL